MRQRKHLDAGSDLVTRYIHSIYSSVIEAM